MRRLFMGLASGLLLVAGLGSPAQAATTTTIVRGSAATWPQLTGGLSCLPSAGSLSAAGSGTVTRFSPWQNPVTPTFPVPGLAPVAPGDRYLSYTGGNGYGHGPIWSGAKTPPTSVSAYVSEVGGAQSAYGLVIGWGTPPGSTKAKEYLGLVPLGALGLSWKKVGFSTATAASSWKWFAFQPNSAGKDAWTGPLTYTLAAVENGRAAWTWKAGVIVGCSAPAAAMVDFLSVTTGSGRSAATRVFNFEGNYSTVSASVGTHAITYGQTVNVAARASAYGGAVPLRLVQCQGLTCSYLGSAIKSSPAGPIMFPLHPLPGYTYGVRFDGDANYNPAQATIGSFTVRPYVRARLSQHHAHAGDRVRVGGIIGPCTGQRRHLVIQRKVGRKWRRVGHAGARRCLPGAANQYARFHGSFTARGLGHWRVRIFVKGSHGYAENHSRPMRLIVTHAPVPHVTVVHYVAPPSSSSSSSTSVSQPAPPPPLRVGP